MGITGETDEMMIKNSLANAVATCSTPWELTRVVLGKLSQRWYTQSLEDGNIFWTGHPMSGLDDAIKGLWNGSAGRLHF